MWLSLALSPRAWGWSGLGSVHIRRGGVIPTRVGMVRLPDGTRSGYGVIPTRVGMVRQRQNCLSGAASYPHARGDGPPLAEIRGLVTLLSPRAWGWSELSDNDVVLGPVIPTRVGMVRHTKTHESNGKVIPTRVGMVRDFIQWRHDSWGYPHARGDGPVTHRPQRSRGSYPHARGDGPHYRTLEHHRQRYPHARGDGPGGE